MIDNSEGFVDDGQATGGEITPEMEDQIRQIEALASMDAAFANSQEYKDLMAATRGINSQSSETDDDEEEEDRKAQGIWAGSGSCFVLRGTGDQDGDSGVRVKDVGLYGDDDNDRGERQHGEHNRAGGRDAVVKRG